MTRISSSKFQRSISNLSWNSHDLNSNVFEPNESINNNLSRTTQIYLPRSINHERDMVFGENRVKVVVSVNQTLLDVACLLENHLNINLRGCQFYLQDRIRLRGESPLIDHCVMISGMVQLLLEIKPNDRSQLTLRLNVVDIQLPENSDFISTNAVEGLDEVNPINNSSVSVSVFTKPQKVTDLGGFHKSVSSSMKVCFYFIGYF